MKLISEKKINTNILSVILYLSFCFSGFYFARGSLAYAAVISGLGVSSVFTNVIIAFFIGGIIPVAVYEILTSFVFRSMKSSFIHAEKMRYALKWFYFAANIVIGLVSLIYYISPLISIYGDIFIPFLIMTVFFVFYIVFICRRYVEKQRISHILIQLGGAYLLFYALFTAFNIFWSGMI